MRRVGVVGCILSVFAYICNVIINLTGWSFSLKLCDGGLVNLLCNSFRHSGGPYLWSCKWYFEQSPQYELPGSHWSLVKGMDFPAKFSGLLKSDRTFLCDLAPDLGVAAPRSFIPGATDGEDPTCLGPRLRQVAQRQGLHVAWHLEA